MRNEMNGRRACAGPRSATATSSADAHHLQESILIVDFKLKMPGDSGTANSLVCWSRLGSRSDGRWYYLPDAMESGKLQEPGKP